MKTKKIEKKLQNEGAITESFSSLSIQEPSKTRICLPKEILYKIFEYASSSTLRNCSSVKRTWNTILTSDYAIKNLWHSVIYHEHAKNKEYWEQTNKTIPLPKNIYSILCEPCPFTKNQRVGNTHALIFMFTTNNNKECDVEELLPRSQAFDVEDILSSKTISDIDCVAYLERENRILEIYKEYGTNTHNKPHWALISKQPVWDFNKLKSLKSLGLGAYQAPTILQAITYMNTIPQNSSFATKCQEVFEGAHLVVGPWSKKNTLRLDPFTPCDKGALIRLLPS